MNDDQLTNGWHKDRETGLPLVPCGTFTNFSEFKDKSAAPARVHKLPVLQCQFDAARFDFTPTLPPYLGWGLVELGAMPVFTIRVQVGPNILYWLANPADQEVWHVLDQWHRAKTIVVVARFQNGKAFVCHRQFELHPKMEALRACLTHAKQLTPFFVAQAVRAIVRDEVKDFASSDIPSVAQLNHVQACMVTTPDTRPAVVMTASSASDQRHALGNLAARLREQSVNAQVSRH